MIHGQNCEQQFFIKTSTDTPLQASARPQESEDSKTQCSSYFPGEPIPGLDEAIKTYFRINATTENLWKNEHLTFM